MLSLSSPGTTPPSLSRLAVICAVRPPPYFKVSSSFVGSSQNQGLALPLCDLPQLTTRTSPRPPETSLPCVLGPGVGDVLPKHLSEGQMWEFRLDPSR